MRMFTVVCRRTDIMSPINKYVRFRFETTKDYKPNSKRLVALADKRRAELIEEGFLPPCELSWVDSGVHDALSPMM